MAGNGDITDVGRGRRVGLTGAAGGSLELSKLEVEALYQPLML